ncbi:MAG TPA: hypothetical protein VHK69_21595, partial [Chitinophagaceae bacterium]|nr:hypothetical protein [Chitinophagaceae bacterium]
ARNPSSTSEPVRKNKTRINPNIDYCTLPIAYFTTYQPLNFSTDQLFLLRSKRPQFLISP